MRDLGFAVHSAPGFAAWAIRTVSGSWVWITCEGERDLERLPEAGDRVAIAIGDAGGAGRWLGAYDFERAIMLALELREQ